MTINSVHNGNGVTIAKVKDQIIVTFRDKPTRYVQDNLRAQGGMCRRNRTERKEWYASYTDDRWQKVHQLLNKGVPSETVR